MRKLIIAEKPSVAKNIAHTIGAYERIMSKSGKFGAFLSDKYYVANAIGHLYGLGTPADYGYSEKWADSYRSGELPMFPDFNIYPIKDDRDELRELLNFLINKEDVEEIICATDAAREGELIFREIYEASGSNKPCKRFWTSSLTEDAINSALNNMKPLSDYDNLYRTAKIRNELDWLFGINLSRNYSVLDGCTHKVGRVITPLLGIIVDRDNEIAGFKSETSYKLVLNGYAESDEEYKSRDEAEKQAGRSAGQPFTVKAAEKENKSENRPKLYSLTRLQQDANTQYGFTADETLKIAQDLYEKKLTTYPRTDSEVISEDMKESMKPLAEMLCGMEDFAEQANEVLAAGLNIDKRVVNNAELTDHHAIIPTLVSNPNISSLPDKHRLIYGLIARRTLMALGEHYEYSEAKYVFECDGITYRAAVKVPVKLGWKKWVKKKDETVQEIPDYSESETYGAEQITVKECRTQPPKRYTDASLLSVMENIHNRLDDDALKEAVKKYGIGTSATRADAIKKLVDTGYVERKDKNLISTDFGRAFADSLPPQILSVERTAEWEQMFNEIEKNGASGSQLYDDTKTLVKNIIEYEKNNTERIKAVNKNAVNKFSAVVVGKCPRCGMDVTEGKSFYGCTSYKSAEDKGCGFSFFKTHRQGWFDGEITPKNAEKLLAGKSITLKTTSKQGEKYDCQWILENNGTYVNVIKAPQTAAVIGKCPRCGMDVTEGKLTFGCKSYKGAQDKGCGFAIWKEDKRGGFTVSAKMAKDLLSKGETTVKIKTLNGEKMQKIKLVEKDVNGKKYVNLEKE